MARKRISPAPQRAAKQPKSHILLSKTATAVFQVTPLARGICNIVGVFADTDIPFYQKGGRYVEAGRFVEVMDVLVAGSQQVYGMWFFVWEVKRRTACRIRLTLAERYYAYWSEPQCHNIIGLFKDTSVRADQLDVVRRPNGASQSCDNSMLDRLCRDYTCVDMTGKRLFYDPTTSSVVTAL